MEYDPLESFRVDEGELELTKEAADQAVANEAQAITQTQLPTSTEVTQTPEEPPAPTTEGASPFRTEDGGVDLDAIRKTGGEFDRIAVDSALDFGTDLVNFVFRTDIPKRPKYENQIAQTGRDLMALLMPTGIATKGIKALTAAGKARAGWTIGNTPFMRFLGDRAAEVGGSLAVGSISEQYEEGDNLLGMAKKALPPQYDFIPDSLATLDGDSPDDKRRKNLFQDIGLGTVQVLAGSMWKMGAAMLGEVGAQVQTNRLVGNSKAARKWLETNKPAVANTVEESVELGMVRLDDALDEVGQYNMYKSPLIDQPMKGVHDMYDYTETGVRAVDDFGIVGASVDQSRITRNLDTVDGRIGSVISEPVIKYGLSGEGNVDDVVLGLARQLNEAGDIGMEGKGWKISLDDQIDDTLNITADLFDPRMSRGDVDRIIQPFITQDDTGKQVLSEEGFGIISKAMRGFGDDITSMDVTRAHSLLAGSLSGRVADLAEAG